MFQTKTEASKQEGIFGLRMFERAQAGKQNQTLIFVSDITLGLVQILDSCVHQWTQEDVVRFLIHPSVCTTRTPKKVGMLCKM